MKIIKKLMGFFRKQRSGGVPILIIKRVNDEDNVKEFNSIEEAIADLEKDPNISAEKIEKLKSSIKNLRDKSSIRIRNGEII